LKNDMSELKANLALKGNYLWAVNYARLTTFVGIGNGVCVSNTTRPE
jgi:hypothetical protein